MEMTENLKKLAEFISGKEEGTKKKISKMEKDELIAYAAENGITVAEEDFAEAEKEAGERAANTKDTDGELSDDELDAVAGGGGCICPAVGGGTEDLSYDSETNEASGDGGCACVVYGQGDRIKNDEHVGARCRCTFGGFGDIKHLGQ